MEIGKASYDDGYALYNAEVGINNGEASVLITQHKRGEKTIQYAVVKLRDVCNMPHGIPVFSNALLMNWLGKHASSLKYRSEIEWKLNRLLTTEQ